ncbi:MAG TPA: hypothetical protein VGD56_02130, partial [Gemmatirosa sp.]
AQLEAALAGEVDRMRTDGVTDAELDRARALVESGFIVALQSAGDRADQISRFACYFGDPALVNAQVGRYQTVTAAQVTAFARETLGEDNRAYLVYVPRAGGEDGALDAEELGTDALTEVIA